MSSTGQPLSKIDQWGKPLDDETLDEILTAAPQGSDWWFDGRDLFYKPAGTNLDQVIVPLPETWHESQEVPQAVGYLIAAAVNYLRAMRGGWYIGDDTRVRVRA